MTLRSCSEANRIMLGSNRQQVKVSKIGWQSWSRWFQALMKN